MASGWCWVVCEACVYDVPEETGLPWRRGWDASSIAPRRERKVKFSAGLRRKNRAYLPRISPVFAVEMLSVQICLEVCRAAFDFAAVFCVGSEDKDKNAEGRGLQGWARILRRVVESAQENCKVEFLTAKDAKSVKEE